MKPRLLFVSRTRYALPLSPSLERKFEPLRRRFALRVLATAVAYSRVHTGVHYPGDVLVGALIGGAAGNAVAAIRR